MLNVPECAHRYKLSHRTCWSVVFATIFFSHRLCTVYKSYQFFKTYYRSFLVGGRTTHLEYMLVKQDHLPSGSDEHKKYLKPPPSFHFRFLKVVPLKRSQARKKQADHEYRQSCQWPKMSVQSIYFNKLNICFWKKQDMGFANISSWFRGLTFKTVPVSVLLAPLMRITGAPTSPAIFFS